jgi:hypothetical protein
MEGAPESSVHVGFDNRDLMILCSARVSLDRRFGPRLAALVRARLSEAAAVPTLADLVALPSVSCEYRQDGSRTLVDIELLDGARLVLAPVVQDGHAFHAEMVKTVVVWAIDANG